MKFCTYDLETLRVFTCCIKDFDTGKKREFAVYRDIEVFVNFLKLLRSLQKHKYYLVGFNSIGFDNQILEFIIGNGDGWLNAGKTCEEIVTLIYDYSQYVISLPQESRFTELVPEWKFKIPTIDLFKQKHYDGKQKGGVMGVSLKWIQFSMRYPNIEEMPVAHDAEITEDMIPDVLKYNWNDVDSTEEFFRKIKFETDLRAALTEKYGINLLNASEPKMARDIFAKFLCDEMGITYRELKEKKTLRSTIPVKDIIFPYISFKTQLFNDLLTNLKGTVLTPQQEYEKIFKVHNIPVTFALGGLHSNNASKVVTKQDGYVIMSCDVVSMYPSLAIQNNLKPEHLGDSFLTVYKRIYEERRTIPKSDPTNYIYKIVLNSSYGLSSEYNSYFYDVQFTRAICINGQLSLLMLAEELILQIPECQFVMLNTDGMEVIIPESKKDLYNNICKQWEKVTKLTLEFGEYEKLAIRDVNNYIAKDTKGKVKRKGIFGYSMNKEDNEMDYHKKPNNLIIPKALEAYFMNGQDYREYIRNCDDIYDFCAAVKRNRDCKLILHTEKGQTEQQKVTRFYVSKTGGKLFKHYISGKLKGRKVGIVADYHVQPANDLTHSVKEDILSDINYNFYIKETEAIITGIEGNSNQLSMAF